MSPCQKSTTTTNAAQCSTNLIQRGFENCFSSKIPAFNPLSVSKSCSKDHGSVFPSVSTQCPRRIPFNKCKMKSLQLYFFVQQTHKPFFNIRELKCWTVNHRNTRKLNCKWRIQIILNNYIYKNSPSYSYWTRWMVVRPAFYIIHRFFSFRLLDAKSEKRLCATRLVHKPFDLIYTDYIGTFYLNEDLGASRTHFRYN